MDLTVGRLLILRSLHDHFPHRTSDLARPRVPRLVTAELLGWFAVSFTALSSFYLPLSVVPTVVVERGGSAVAAGWVMSALLGSAVAAEVLAPRMLRLCSARCLAAIGLGTMAVASAAIALAPTTGAVVGLSGLQGLGFGALVVVVAAEIGALLPNDRRGEGLGVAGLVACVPAVTGLPRGPLARPPVRCPLVEPRRGRDRAHRDRGAGEAADPAGRADLAGPPRPAGRAAHRPPAPRARVLHGRGQCRRPDHVPPGHDDRCHDRGNSPPAALRWRPRSRGWWPADTAIVTVTWDGWWLGRA